MAVPFALPEDEINNLIAAVIFLLSQSRIQRENRELQECMEDLVRLLVEELARRYRSEQYDNQLRQTLLLLRRSLDQFPRMPRRTRANSESSCCDEKALAQAEDDCTQVGLILPDGAAPPYDKEDVEKAVEMEGSFLWRLVSQPRRRTLWTALPLLCMMGWHLFGSSM